MQKAISKLEKSKVTEDDGNKFHSARTSSSCWLWKSEGETIKIIDQRAGYVAHVPVELRREEAMQVVHYLPGQFYRSHNDFFDPEIHKHNKNVQAGVNRLLTIFFYLNTVEQGGETIFPYAGPTGYRITDFVNTSSCARGIGVKPKTGSAVLWYSLEVHKHMEGKCDFNSLHGACEPVSGEKFGANKWIYQKPRVEGFHSYEEWDISNILPK